MRFRFGIRGGLLGLTLLAVCCGIGCDDGGGGDGFEALAVADRTTGNAPLTVTFRARANGPLSAEYTYAWDFDDGSTSDQPEPLHVFAAPGTYTVAVEVAANAGGSGRATVEVVVEDSADLDVGEVQVVPQRAQAGSAVRISWGLRNAGAPVIGDYDLVVFLSERPAFDEQAILLGSIARSADPTSDAFQGEEREFTVPEGVASGEWFVGVFADPEGRIGDGNRDNNLTFAPFPLTVRNSMENGPDLTICGLSVPAFDDVPLGRRPQVPRGDQLPISVCLGNVGDQPVGQASYVLYLSTDDQPDAEDIVVGRRGDLPLGSGDRQDFDDVLDLPVDLEPGAWFLIADADPEDLVPERLEDNNVRVYSTSFDVVLPEDVSGVDLVLAELQIAEAGAFWGQALTGQLRILNRGDEGVERPFVVRVLAEPLDGGESIQLPSLNVPRFAADGDEVFALRLNITPRVPQGQYRITAIVDPTNATGDVNTGNNRRTLQAVLELGGQPDFDPAVSNVRTNTNMVDAGDTLEVTGLLANLGGDGTGPLEVVVVFSPDATFDRSDVEVDRFQLEDLPGEGEALVERTVTVPLELDQQVLMWRVGIMADPENRLSGEASEENNAGFAPEPVQVTGAQGGCNEDDENEDNDVPQGARRLGAGLFEGLGICDDADWYSVRVPAGRVFDVRVRWDVADGVVTLRQADRDGVTIREAEGGAGELRLFEPPGAEDLTHYFVITGAGGRLQYDLEIGVSPSGEGPNLRVRAVQPTPAIAEAGASIDVSYEVVNVGGARAEATMVRAELVVGEGVVELGTADVPALDPGTGAPGRLRAQLPAELEDGRYTVRVVADAAGVLEEGNEDDNVGEGVLRIDAEQACQADALEPNRSPQEGDPGDAQAAVLEVGQFADLVACDGDDDWYAIDLMADQRLAVEASFISADGDLEMQLYGPDGQTLLDVSDGLQNTERVELLRAEAAGRYFVRVYLNQADAVNVANTYSLAVAIGDADECADDAFPNNGDSAAAVLLPDGPHDLVLCPGDEDWFRFPIPAGNTVSYQLAAGGSGARIALFDPDGTLIDEDGRRIVHTAERNGMYRLRVAVDREDRSVYSLTVSGVSGVDLAVDGLVLSAERAAPGDDLRADLTVSNRRGDQVDEVLVRFLFSLDEAPSADDVILGERVIPTIAGADVVALRQRLRLPPDLRPDDGFVVVVLDPEREAADVRPGNNVGAVGLAVVAVCEDDDQRENEGPRSATPLDEVMAPLAGGVICPFTEDWYRLPVVAAGAVAIELRFQNARGDLDLEVYAGDGLLLGASRTEEDVERVELNLEGPQTIYLRVDGFLDAQNDFVLDWMLP